jgi:hypothetical protein
MTVDEWRDPIVEAGSASIIRSSMNGNFLG